MEVRVRGLLLALALVLAAALSADAQVHIDIRLPGPPSLAIIPEVPVYYVPAASANVFFYGHQYWVFHAGAWHVGPGWNGPWVVVAPVHVPVPILRVPVRYYKVRPGHWKTWRYDGPPRWDAHYGREWREADHERRWREREEHWAHDKHPGKGQGHARGRGKGKRDD
jgi:hypothetical protein